MTPRIDEIPKRELFNKAVEVLSSQIYSYPFKIDARQKPSDFSRKGKLGFENTILIALNFCSKTMQIEIDHFYELIGEPEYAVTKAAYFDARTKLKYETFSILLDSMIEIAAGDHPSLKTYGGYRIFALDGSILTLPDTWSLRGVFGVAGGLNGVASARLSTLTDVLNSGIIMDVRLTKYSAGERESALNHYTRLDSLGIGDKSLVLHDRGYISEQMIRDLKSKNIHYIFRVPKGWNKAVDKLDVNTDAIMEIKVNGAMLTERIVKFELDNGETETLLVDPALPAEIFTFEKLKEIYFLRWGIEINYNVLKNELQVENFTGTSSLFIKQDVYATAILLNFVAFTKLESDEIIEMRTAQKKNKHPQKTNENLLIGYMKDKLILALLAGSLEERAYYIESIIRSAARYPIPVRTGRSCPRVTKHRAKHPNNRKRAI